MARRFYNRIRTGVAGWSYDDWHGTVYPVDAGPDFDPLGFLSRSKEIRRYGIAVAEA